MFYTTKSIMKNKNKCKENWETLPYSSEHVWRADHHGVASGDCQKCGHPYAEWSRKLKNMLDPNVPKLPLSKKSMMSKAIPPAKGERWEKDAVGKNIHTVYVLCNECHKFGVPLPLERQCGDCGSMDTMTYYDRETIGKFRSQAYEEGKREAIEEVKIKRRQFQNKARQKRVKLGLCRYCNKKVLIKGGWECEYHSKQRSRKERLRYTLKGKEKV